MSRSIRTWRGSEAETVAARPSRSQSRTRGGRLRGMASYPLRWGGQGGIDQAESSPMREGPNLRQGVSLVRSTGSLVFTGHDGRVHNAYSADHGIRSSSANDFWD